MKLLCNLSDDHHPAPTFTPPELPKRVHVRGVTAGKTKSILNKSIHITANFKLIKTKPKPAHTIPCFYYGGSSVRFYSLYFIHPFSFVTVFLSLRSHSPNETIAFHCGFISAICFVFPLFYIMDFIYTTNVSAVSIVSVGEASQIGRLT